MPRLRDLAILVVTTDGQIAGTEAAAKRETKKKFNGAKNVMYENISIALSPDVRYACNECNDIIMHRHTIV